jgi:hypothetical protein
MDDIIPDAKPVTTEIMKLYFFVKSADGNVTRRGGIDCTAPPELEELIKTLSEAGEVPAEAEEWDAQVLKGAEPEAEPEAQPEPEIIPEKLPDAPETQT